MILDQPEAYLKEEFTQLMDQPRIDWNIASVANHEDWTKSLPVISTLLNNAKQSVPLYSVSLAVKAEDIRFSAVVADDADYPIAAEYRLLSERWLEETRPFSSVSDMVMHPAYQRIMAMGQPAVPLILRDLRDRSSHWLYALRFIAGRDVAEGAETIPAARAAWLAWGRENGYI
jgi:hypothetical protein